MNAVAQGVRQGSAGRFSSAWPRVGASPEVTVTRVGVEHGIPLLSPRGCCFAWLGNTDFSLSMGLSHFLSSLGFITQQLDSKSKPSRQGTHSCSSLTV